MDTVKGGRVAVLVMTMVFLLARFMALKVSAGSKPRRMSASLSEMMELSASPNTMADSTTPPRWAMPWISLILTGTPEIRAASPRTLEASRLPWPPTATMINRVVSIYYPLFFNRSNGVFRADLGAERTAHTGVGIDFHPAVFYVEGRAGNGIDAVLVVLALVRYPEGAGFEEFDAFCVKHAGFPGDDDGYALKGQGFFDGINAFFDLKGFDHGHV